MILNTKRILFEFEFKFEFEFYFHRLNIDKTENIHTEDKHIYYIHSCLIALTNINNISYYITCLSYRTMNIYHIHTYM
jgi:hypothetical protein